MSGFSNHSLSQRLLLSYHPEGCVQISLAKIENGIGPRSLSIISVRGGGGLPAFFSTRFWHPYFHADGMTKVRTAHSRGVCDGALGAVDVTGECGPARGAGGAHVPGALLPRGTGGFPLGWNTLPPPSREVGL